MRDEARGRRLLSRASFSARDCLSLSLSQRVCVYLCARFLESGRGLTGRLAAQAATTSGLRCAEPLNDVHTHSLTDTQGRPVRTHAERK